MKHLFNLRAFRVNLRHFDFICIPNQRKERKPFLVDISRGEGKSANY